MIFPDQIKSYMNFQKKPTQYWNSKGKINTTTCEMLYQYIFTTNWSNIC